MHYSPGLWKVVYSCEAAKYCVYLEFLRLGGHLLGSSDVAVAKVEGRVEIFVRGDAGRVTAALTALTSLQKARSRALTNGLIWSRPQQLINILMLK